jgi:hypothetical protein
VITEDVDEVERPDRASSRIAASLACALILAPSLSVAADTGKSRPLSGEWGILIVQPVTGCEWNGVIRLIERGGELSGRGSATASSASPRCPRLEGKVNGTVAGELVQFGFGTGPLGRAQFEGRIAAGAGEMTGTWATRSASGDWAAAR